MGWHDEPTTERRGEPATARRGDGDSAADDGAAGGAATGAGTSTSARMGVDRRATSNAVTVQYSRRLVKEAIGNGDGVFVWKESAIGHCCFISL